MGADQGHVLPRGGVARWRFGADDEGCFDVHVAGARELPHPGADLYMWQVQRHHAGVVGLGDRIQITTDFLRHMQKFEGVYMQLHVV